MMLVTFAIQAIFTASKRTKSTSGIDTNGDDSSLLEVGRSNSSIVPQCKGFSCSAGYSGDVDSEEKCKAACMKCLGEKWSCSKFGNDGFIGLPNDLKCDCSEADAKGFCNFFSPQYVCRDAGVPDSPKSDKSSASIVKLSLAVLLTVFIVMSK